MTYLEGDVGIAEDVSWEEYATWPGVSRSRLWTLYSQTPAHFRYEEDHPEAVETAAMAQGTAVHCAVLEPERFEEAYCTGGPINAKTGRPFGRDTAAFAEWAADQGKTPITAEEWAMCMAIRKAIMAHPLAGVLIGKGRREVSLQWVDGPTGLLRKARLDKLLTTRAGMIIVDVKTTRCAAPHAFGGDVYRNGVLWQMADYRMGLVAVTGQQVEDVLLVAAEKAPPYALAIYHADSAQLELGEAQVTDALRQLELCRRYDDWPGYPEGIESLMLPGWAGQEWTPFADGLEAVLRARATRAGRALPPQREEDDDDGYIGL